jgi:hypothetical protein
VTETLKSPAVAEAAAPDRGAIAFHWLAVGALLLLAAALGLAGLTQRYNLQSYDEGVYWETLRAMARGLPLYSQVFLSQPPLFPLSIYPFYHLLGGTIGAARLALVVYSLLGLIGAYLSGLQLAGRTGGLLALLLAASASLHLGVPRHLEAEGPANALLFLALAAALWWWRHRREPLGILAMTASGGLVMAGMLIKLLDVTGCALLALMLLTALARAVRQGERPGWVLAAGPGAALGAAVAALAVLAPFAADWPQLYQQAIQFHLEARHAYPLNTATNFRIISNRLLMPSAALCAMAAIGLGTAAWRKDVRGLFLGGWLAVSFALLLAQTPFFGRHAIIMLPPLIASSMLAIDRLVTAVGQSGRAPIVTWALPASMILIGIAAIAGFAEQIDLIETEAQISQRDRPVLSTLAEDIRAHVAAGQWVITDQQLAAAMAGRDTPPGLVDTSWVRIDSGFLAPAELCAQARNPRVAALLFSTGRLSSRRVASFKTCIAPSFRLLTDDGRGTSLWVRR